MPIELSPAEAAVTLFQETLRGHTEYAAKKLHGSDWRRWYYSEASLMKAFILQDPIKNQLMEKAAKRAMELDVDLELLPEKQRHPLNQREIDFIRFRFGFIDGQLHTLTEMSKLHNLSIERVRGIVRYGVAKLKGPLRITILTSLSLK